MNISNILRSVLISIIFVNGVLAQTTKSSQHAGKPQRIEIELQSNAEPFQTIPLGEKGILVFYQSTRETENSKSIWVFTLYSINFDKIWNKEIGLNDEMECMGFDILEDGFCLFFQNEDKKTSDKNFYIVELKYEQPSERIINGLLPKKAELQDFEVKGRTAYAAMNLRKEKASVFSINLNNSEIKEISLDQYGQVYIKNMVIDTVGDNLMIFVKVINSNRQYEMVMLEYSLTGRLKKTIIINVPQENQMLLTAMPVKISDSNTIVLGTYFQSDKKTVKPGEGFKESTTGFYFANISERELSKIDFYSFVDFRNFYQYLNDNEALRQKKKVDKKRQSGKDYSVDFHLLVHDVIKRNRQNILIVEAYRPEYRSVTSMTYDIYGRPMPSSYTVFDGYRYTNAVVVGFDNEGKLLWDHSFRMFNVLSFDLRERVNLLFDETEIVIAYNNQGEVTSKIINNEDVIEEQDKNKIETDYVADKIMSDYSSDMDYWYDSYFICYGYQKIKNNSMSQKTKRIVFYMNKIVYK